MSIFVNAHPTYVQIAAVVSCHPGQGQFISSFQPQFLNLTEFARCRLPDSVSVRFSKLLSLRAYKSLVSRLIVCVGFAASFNQLPSPRAFKSLGFSYPLPVSAGVQLPDFSTVSCLCRSHWFLRYIFLQAYTIMVSRRNVSKLYVRTILWVCRCLSLFGI